MFIDDAATRAEHYACFKSTQIILSGSIIALSWADAYITKFILDEGFGREGNPLLSPLVGDGSFFLVKVIGTLVAVLILWDVYRRQPKLAHTISQVFTAAYCAIVWWNVIIAGSGLMLA